MPPTSDTPRTGKPVKGKPGSFYPPEDAPEYLPDGADGAIGDPVDPADFITSGDFADDLGNLIGQPQQYFVEGREPLPTDDGDVLDPDDDQG
jgi:hypothetical protein